MATTLDISKATITNTVTYDDYDCHGEQRQRVKFIEAAVVRRKGSVPRDSSLRPLCMRATSGYYDDYPAHTEGGHLIGLHIGGLDHSYNLVPMFAGFNQVTWKAHETAIYKDTSITRMRVGLSYTAADPRLPAQLWIRVQRGTTDWTMFAVQHMMDQPMAPVYTVTEGARAMIRTAYEEMVAAHWVVEQFPGCEKWPLPSPGDRRYAMLDYMVLVKGNFWSELLPELGLDVQYFFMLRGAGFTDTQRQVIMRVNYIMNGDAVKSDLSGLRLLYGSTTDAPQIDHIISKTVGTGPNAFSNAMVLSALENQTKSG